jgi:predicted Zn-ribbon and HTH transcriptional regulator
MSKCADCGIEIPTEQLSGLNTCPNCVGKWVREYRALHDRRYGKRVKVS